MNPEIISFATQNYLVLMGIVILTGAIGKILERSGSVPAARTIFVFTLIGCLTIDAICVHLLSTPALGGWAGGMFSVWLFITLFNIRSLLDVW